LKVAFLARCVERFTVRCPVFFELLEGFGRGGLGRLRSTAERNCSALVAIHVP
jgi:hypothetical protein